MVELFTFPDDVRWDDDEDAILFTVQIGEYRGDVIVPRRVLQSLAGRRLKPEECIEQFHMNRTGFERVAQAKDKALDLDENANIRIRGADLRPASSSV